MGFLPIAATLASLALAAPAPPPGLAKPAFKEPVVALFRGKPSDLAEHWTTAGSNRPAPWIVAHGAMLDRQTNIATKEKFQDFYLHVEFKLPSEPTHHGQERANSGVYLQGRYEIQVLDSYGIADPGSGDCSAVYNEAAPLVNACRPPLQWETYDILFRSARLDPQTHRVTERARVTLIFNGIVVQNNVEMDPNGGSLDDRAGTPGPIMLQCHGPHDIWYRNIWAIPLPEHGASHY